MTMRRSTPRRRLTLVVAGMVLVAVAWLAVTVSVAGIARNPNPALAVRLSGDAGATANLAEQLVRASGDADTRAAAKDMAREAIRHDPTVVSAYQTLGMIASMEGREADAARAFQYGGRLTKRELGTEIWLIAYEAQRGNVSAALDHYDRALRVDSDARPLLIPPLVQALADRTLIDPLSKLFASAPDWRTHFLNYAILHGRALDNLSSLVDRVNRSPSPLEPSVMNAFMARLVKDGRFDLAAHQHAQMTGTPLGDSLRNGDFENGEVLPPFGWNFTTQSDFSAIRTSAPDASGNIVLFVTYGGGAPKSLVRQLVTLRPGRYSLRGRALVERLNDGTPPVWSLICAGGGAVATIAAKDTQGRWETFGEDFVVPPRECSAQWLSLGPGRGGIDTRAAVYFDDLQLSAAGA